MYIFKCVHCMHVLGTGTYTGSLPGLLFSETFFFSHTKRGAPDSARLAY